MLTITDKMFFDFKYNLEVKVYEKDIEQLDLKIKSKNQWKYNLKYVVIYNI